MKVPWTGLMGCVRDVFLTAGYSAACIHRCTSHWNL